MDRPWWRDRVEWWELVLFLMVWDLAQRVLNSAVG